MILCATLNPSWDVTHVCRGWQAGGVVRAEGSFAFAGGKGINVARGLRDLGDSSISTGLASGPLAIQIREENSRTGAVLDRSARRRMTRR